MKLQRSAHAEVSLRFLEDRLGSAALEIPDHLKGETHPPKKTHPIKTQFAQTISELFEQIVPSCPLKISEQVAERVCANCLCKLFLFGWVVSQVGRLSLNLDGRKRAF